jgi:hypothetical protein
MLLARRMLRRLSSADYDTGQSALRRVLASSFWPARGVRPEQSAAVTSRRSAAIRMSYTSGMSNDGFNDQRPLGLDAEQSVFARLGSTLTLLPIGFMVAPVVCGARPVCESVVADRRSNCLRHRTVVFSDRIRLYLVAAPVAPTTLPERGTEGVFPLGGAGDLGTCVPAACRDRDRHADRVRAGFTQPFRLGGRLSYREADLPICKPPG